MKHAPLLLLLSVLASEAFTAPRRQLHRPRFTFRSEAADAEVVEAPSEEGVGVVEDMTESAASLKTRIFAACAASDRGFAASPADRAEIESLLDEISPLSPIEDPARGISEGADDAPLKACWRLVYTSASDVATLSANPIAALGGIYQDARELPIIMNVIDTKPRALDNLPPAAASAVATATRLNVQTRARPRGPSRVGLSFESIEVEPLQLLGMDLPSWLPPLKVDLPQLGLDLQRQIFGVSADEDPRDAASNPAFFDIKYLDDDFLVIRQGSNGIDSNGLFAAIKVNDLDVLAK